MKEKSTPVLEENLNSALEELDIRSSSAILMGKAAEFSAGFDN